MWDFIINPFVTTLTFLYSILGQNVVLAIVVFTVLVRLITYPLTIQQQRSTKAMQQLQPELKKLQEKYKNDPETLQAKTLELYREAGVNPLGGCLPTLIQFPILIALYQAITRSLAASPLQLIDLSQHVYELPDGLLNWLPRPTSLIPLDSNFAWLNLGQPDPYFILPVLVVVTTWLQQKLMTPPSTDPQSAAMSRSMQLTMPLFIGYISLTFPSGLSIYWILSNIIGFIQYAAMGRASLKNLFGTEDGSFSLSGLLGLPQPEPEQKGRVRRGKK